MRSRLHRLSSFASIIVFGLAFGGGYWATAGPDTAAVEVPDDESAALIGGGGYDTLPFNCYYCSLFCAVGCPSAILSYQTQNAESGKDQRVTTGLVPCGGAGYIYNCDYGLAAPPPLCNM